MAGMAAHGDRDRATRARLSRPLAASLAVLRTSKTHQRPGRPSPACRYPGARPAPTPRPASPAITSSGRATWWKSPAGCWQPVLVMTLSSPCAIWRATQENDGHWPQNQWVDGVREWRSIQLDETALPVLLVNLLRRNGALDEDNYASFWPMVDTAVKYILRTGPPRWKTGGRMCAGTHHLHFPS